MEPIDLAFRFGPIMNELHRTEFSDRFWARYLIPYARACVRQRTWFDDAFLDTQVPFLPILGAKPCSAAEARNGLVHEILRNVSVAIKKSFWKVNPKRRAGVICYGVRAEVVAEACQADHVKLYWFPFYFRKDREARIQLNEIAQRQEEVFFRNALKFMPSAYVEYHKSLREKAEKVVRENRPKEIYYEHYQTHLQTLTSFIASEKGAVLKNIQGGYLREDAGFIDKAKRLERDKIMTYGWKFTEQDEPFYAVRLEEYSQSYTAAARQKKTIDALVVYNALDTPEKKKACVDTAQCISENLDREKYRNVTLRPRGKSRYFSSRLSITQLGIPGNLNVDAGTRPMSKLSAQSRIIVHLEYPATNFLECIFVKHPVMVVLGEYELGGVSAGFLHEFRRLGVWHENLNDLVQFLNGIQLETWWGEVEISRAFNEFRETFARSRASYEREEGIGSGAVQ